MAANIHKGELDIRLGGQTRTLRFKTSEVMLLQKRLGMDVMAYLGASGGIENFLCEAIFAGLSRDKKAKIHPQRVAAWLDDEDKPPQLSTSDSPASRTELRKAILYAIARGKPKEEAEEFVQVLDEMFEEEDTTLGNDSPSPSVFDETT